MLEKPMAAATAIVNIVFVIKLLLRFSVQIFLFCLSFKTG